MISISVDRWSNVIHVQVLNLLRVMAATKLFQAGTKQMAVLVSLRDSEMKIEWGQGMEFSTNGNSSSLNDHCNSSSIVLGHSFLRIRIVTCPGRSTYHFTKHFVLFGSMAVSMKNTSLQSACIFAGQNYTVIEEAHSSSCQPKLRGFIPIKTEVIRPVAVSSCPFH